MIDAIAVEAAAQMVVDAAARHLSTGKDHVFERFRCLVGGQFVTGGQQEQEIRRRRKLWRGSEAAMVGVGLLEQAHGGLGHRQHTRCGCAAGCRRARQARHDPLGRLVDGLASAAIGTIDGGQYLTKRRESVARGRRVVRAAMEGRSVWATENGERPAAVARESHDRVHVDLVDIGSLFAIDLDVHEQSVHQGRRLGIFEGFVRHHVAPVAGAVADRDQQGLVGLAGLGQCLGAPGPPVHGVVHVLAEVGARLLGQSVGGLAGGPVGVVAVQIGQRPEKPLG